MPFSRIYGHQGPIAFLRKSLAGNRIAQGYLFHGIPGVGKKTTALEFAKALNCLEREEVKGKPCQCCRKIESGNHPDVLELSPEGLFIKIDHIRDLSRRMSFRPLEGRRRVVIIDDAHSMNEAAANALLKTLEEPTPDNVLILVTHLYHSLPATILSRCRKVRFAPLPVPVVEQFLLDQGEIENREISARATASGGSIGRALALDPEAVRQFRETVASFLWSDSWDLTDNPLAPFEVADGFGEDRNGVERGLELLEEWLRDVLVYHETERGELIMHRELADLTRASAKILTRRQILERIEAIHAARRAVWRNGNRQLILESMILKFLSPPGRDGVDTPRANESHQVI